MADLVQQVEHEHHERDATNEHHAEQHPLGDRRSEQPLVGRKRPLHNDNVTRPRGDRVEREPPKGRRPELTCEHLTFALWQVGEVFRSSWMPPTASAATPSRETPLRAHDMAYHRERRASWWYPGTGGRVPVLSRGTDAPLSRRARVLFSVLVLAVLVVGTLAVVATELSR